MLQLRKSGLRVSGKANLKASETKDGKWVAWMELQGIPVSNDSGRPLLFEGSTRYQAQCAAYRHFFPEASPLWKNS